MQPLANSATPANGQVGSNVQRTQTAPAEPGNSGVVLRWRTSARVGSEPRAATHNQPINAATYATNNSVATAPSLAAQALEANTARPPASPAGQHTARFAAQPQPTMPASSTSNPLRSSAGNNHSVTPAAATTSTFVPRGSAQRSAVQPANYQAPATNAQQDPRMNLPGDSIVPPTAPTPNASGFQPPPMLEPPANLPPTLPPQDALTLPEDAPAPPVAPATPDNFPRTPDLGAPPSQDLNLDNQLRSPEAPQDSLMPPKDDEAADPFKNRNKEDVESPSDRESARRSRELEKKKDEPNASANCEAFRDKLRNSSIQKISLNAAPRYGQGLSDDPEKSEKQRLDFAASSEERDWCDRKGRTLIRGRMIDLINEQVVLDINGVRREVPLRDLCDVDLAYVGKVWHLPVTCGTGYDEVPARSFVPSAIQWKASGLCHKPLYFEEVQLERYGHEIGPILQPLVSTAHFFGNIAVLPYKMGIHPPHECQYSLGYYRPGDCAPYMLPPVPISLRGAAVQAGAVVGGAALVP